MAEFYPIKNIIDNAINLDLGNPNLAISDKEALLKEAAISLGTLDYYRSFPMRITMCTAYSSSSGGVGIYEWTQLVRPQIDRGLLVIPFSDVFTKGTPVVPNDQIKNAYFLGVMKCERPTWNTWSNPSMWNMQMFGIQTGATNYDLMKTTLSNTLDDLSTGQPRYNINRMQNRIEMLQPWGFGLVSWDLAIGFTSPEYVEMSKVDWLCKFISYRFIESIIQARAGVELQAEDFKISVEHLKERLARLKEECDSIKNHSVLNMAQWAG